MTASLNALGLVCALGQGKAAVARNLLAGDTAGMRPHADWVPERTLTLGAVDTELPALPAELAACDSRNNRLLLAAALEIEPELRAAVARHGAARVGVVLGTSTSGIQEASLGIGEQLRTGALPADYRYAQQELVAPAAFLAAWLGSAGPAYCISTACTSSARALLSARRLLQLGVCDAVVCGGVDSLCGLTLNGFAALEAVSDSLCNPLSRNRRGINIGEGAALFLMERDAGGIALLGAGAGSDAHHISAPEPSGLGAQRAMRQALVDAGLEPSAIDYLNLHGTATQHNDAMESLATTAVFPEGVPASSTKPLTGHTLGAAGALEAAFCWLALSPWNPEHRLPPHRWDGEPDPELPALRLVDGASRLPTQRPRRLMSNSFAFGGSNISLILGDAP
ncbi:beta-ketoacyl-[acyl-carrier-protein] synthase family protein [Metapseudomonas otitidis]|uniref:beta-ketoacyl-[acyl-carrier-protein] synthase family protein n=1 Tax=Metapseudomonas otitidis TaxID=319939 RepID=UPI0040557CA0